MEEMQSCIRQSVIKMAYYIKILETIEKLFQKIIGNNEKLEELKLFLEMLDIQEKNRITTMLDKQKQEFEKEMEEDMYNLMEENKQNE